MKVALWTGSLGLSTRESLAAAGAAGADGVVLAALQGDLAAEQMGESARREVRSLLGRHKIALAALSGRLLPRGEVADPDRVHEQAIEAFGLLRDLGGDLWTIPLDSLVDIPLYLRGRHVAEALKVILAAAERSEVRVGLATGTESAAPWADVFARYPHPLLGLSYDPARSYLFGGHDPVGIGSALAPRLLLVRWRDIRRLGSWDPAEYAAALDREGTAFRPGAWWVEAPLGDGEVPFVSLADVLRQSDFKGWLVTGRQFVKDPVAAARGDIAYLRGDDAPEPQDQGLTPDDSNPALD